MSDFNPGEGWRLWDGETAVTRPLLRLEHEDGSTLYWVRAEPVPQLGRDPLTDPEDYRLIANVLTALAKWKEAKQ